jgi:2-polyprenyl-6-methoxyphenol hydroxylase-like FAD-dependent oxidoreductase
MKSYDIVTIGGGLGGSALAKAMAERGYRLLVVEGATAFKDRIRGDQMASWGAVEAKELGIYDLILESNGNEMVWWDMYLGSGRIGHRDLTATTPSGLPNLSFFHPEMQEALIAAAETAGAEVRRGARVKAAKPGDDPEVTIEWDGGSETVSCRMVVACDGRSSGARRWCGFQTRRDEDRLQIAGLLFDGMEIEADTARLCFNIVKGQNALLFPQGGGRVRSYIASWKALHPRLQGEAAKASFVEEAKKVGIPGELFEGAEPVGPLATFDGADEYVEHPYRDGIALIGDAAASSDPAWGQGISLTLRDVRTLRDKFLETEDWHAAGDAYAAAHDEYYGRLHTFEDWLTKLMYEPGKVGIRRRRRLMTGEVNLDEFDPFQSGPESSEPDAATREAVLGA